MRNTKAMILAVAVCTALVAVLGLAACDSSSSTSAADSTTSASTSEAASTASTESKSQSTESKSESSTTNSEGPITSAAEEIFANWLQGMDNNGVIYFYADDTESNSAMLMIYDTENDTFASYTGKLEKPSDGTVKINTKGAGESITFKVAATEDNSGTVYTFSNGSSVTMGPLIDDEAKEFLRSLDEFASEVDSSSDQAETTENAESNKTAESTESAA